MARVRCGEGFSTRSVGTTKTSISSSPGRGHERKIAPPGLPDLVAVVLCLRRRTVLMVTLSRVVKFIVRFVSSALMTFL